MIPKKIHMVWLSGEEKPKSIKKCIATWKKIMPDYEIKEWSMKDISHILCSNISGGGVYMKEAINTRKWAFASDYIRLYAVYTEGGFYMDSDVIVRRRFDDFLNYDFVSSVEYHPEALIENQIGYNGKRIQGVDVVSGIGIQAAIFGGSVGNKFCKEILDWYSDKHFVVDGKTQTDIISPAIYANVAEERLGFQFKNENQDLGRNMMIFESSVFAGGYQEKNEKTYAIHMSEGTWRDRTIVEKLKIAIIKNPITRKILGKESIKY